MATKSKYVPLIKAMGNYHSGKKENPDAILIFRWNGFYDMYEKDAREAAEILGVDFYEPVDDEGYSLMYSLVRSSELSIRNRIEKLESAGRKVLVLDIK